MFEKNYTVVMDINQLQPKLRPTSNANIGTAATEVLLETSTIDRLFSFHDRIISAGIHYMGKT